MEVSIKYVAAEGSRYSDKDATVIGPVLEQLAESGASTASDIVDAAKSKRSPLHRYFEWDNKAAGEKWRVQQARVMVGSIRVILNGDSKAQPVRAFYAVLLTDEEEASEHKGRSYQTIRMVSADEYKSAQIVREAEQALLGWQSRYAIYKHLFPAGLQAVSDAIEAALPVVETEDDAA